MSFGYQNGAPSHAGKIYDVRTLTHDVNSAAFKDMFKSIVEDVRGNPSTGGVVAIGCEHGKHRSVALANRVASALRQSVVHRDV